MTKAIHLNAGVLPSSGSVPTTNSPAANAPAAPDASAAAADMGRDPTIRAMVQGLADRMAKSPNDLAGWQRLAHAYVVMGELGKARQAADHVVALKPDAVASQLALAEVQKAAAAPGDEIPKDFIATMRTVLKLDSTNAQALYYVGLAEAKAGHSAEARTLWTKALSSVPADDPLAAALRAHLGGLPK